MVLRRRGRVDARRKAVSMRLVGILGLLLLVAS